MKYTIKLGSCIDGTVPLGWQNENKVKEVYFDASKWVAEYGAGILTLAIQRNGDTQPYPKALTDDTWTIEAVDVEKKGIGEFQVTFTVGEQVKESAVYKFFVERSLDSTGEMPDPYISYFEQIVEVGAQAEADADRAEEAADSIKNLTAEAETLPAGSSASASYDSETGVMTFGIPKGEQGERGADGVTPDIDIGTVETLETGVPAYANITGTVENPSLNLGLPKGNTGDTGATGAPAGFGAVTATIDGTTGTPSVDVTASGADTAKNFAFAFHNLKGEQGEQGEQGDPGVVQDVTVNGTSVVDQNGVAVITMPELVKTVQGNPIVLDDAFGAVKNLDVELTPIQDLHGYDKPWNGGAGKNKLHNTATSQTINGITFTVNTDGTVIANGTATANANLILNNTDVLTDGNYKLNGCPAGGGVGVYFIGGSTNSGLDTIDTGTGGPTAAYDSGKALRIFVRIASGQTVSNLTFKPMIRVSTEADATFAPYENICPITGHDSVTVTDTDGDSQSQSKTVTLPHTVYGGKPNITTGNGTEKCDIVDLSTLAWFTSGAYYVSTDLINLVKKPSDNTQKANAYAEKYNVVYRNDTNNDGDIAVSSDGYIFCRTSSSPTGQFCYEKATPTDLTTTPTDLTLYNGDNVISSDGDIDLTYVQDMAIVIRKIEAQL